MQQRELLSELAREVVRLQIFCSGNPGNPGTTGASDRGPDQVSAVAGDQLSSQLEMAKIV